MKTTTQTETATMPIAVANPSELNNADRPATRKQLWALYCIYKTDHRDKGLTMQEASELISKAPKNASNSKSGAKAKQGKQANTRPFGVELFNSLSAKADGDGGMGISAKDVAKLMREELKEVFPATKFSVRKDRSTINVDWVDGETGKEVDDVVKKYAGEDFDGMIDMRFSNYHYLTPEGKLVYGGTDGSTGSGGVYSPSEKPAPEGAKKVYLYSDFVFTHRGYSENNCGYLVGDFNLNKENPTIQQQVESWLKRGRRGGNGECDSYTIGDNLIKITFVYLSEWDYALIKKCLEAQGAEVSQQPKEKGCTVIVKWN